MPRYVLKSVTWIEVKQSSSIDMADKSLDFKTSSNRMVILPAAVLVILVIGVSLIASRRQQQLRLQLVPSNHLKAASKRNTGDRKAGERQVNFKF